MMTSVTRMTNNKRSSSLTEKIDSNRAAGKKRKHLTIVSDAAAADDGETTPDAGWSPPDWMATVDRIRKMREDVVAPVDEMGCDQAADLTEPPEVCSQTRSDNLLLFFF